jgi:hypothetical protein
MRGAQWLSRSDDETSAAERRAVHRTENASAVELAIIKDPAVMCRACIVTFRGPLPISSQHGFSHCLLGPMTSYLEVDPGRAIRRLLGKFNIHGILNLETLYRARSHQSWPSRP